MLESENILVENRTKWDTRVWVTLKNKARAARIMFDQQCETCEIEDKSTNIVFGSFDELARRIERVIKPLEPELVRCPACRPYNPNEIAGAGACVPPRWAFGGCKLCETFGNGGGLVQKKYYFTDVAIDGVVFHAVNRNCVDCYDSGKVNTYICIPHPTRHMRSNHMCGVEPIVRLPCHGCHRERNEDQYRQVKSHFMAQFPAYPENLRFESAEDALRWKAPTC